mmetsp:Transcript_29251/g.59834  ORF Transcript_29251/g.59834 Transcript_29251/m.59834 type:complete len:104 (+) Transcript_29251:593-904(+)
MSSSSSSTFSDSVVKLYEKPLHPPPSTESLKRNSGVSFRRSKILLAQALETTRSGSELPLIKRELIRDGEYHLFEAAIVIIRARNAIAKADVIDFDPFECSLL